MRRMSRQILRTMGALVVMIASMWQPVTAARPVVAIDTLTIRKAFAELPVSVMEILPRNARLDLLDYWAADSVGRVRNSMEGFSYLIPPASRDYIKVKLTPASVIELKILPLSKDNLLGISYTIGDEGQAHDSDLRFYNSRMQEQRRDRYIRLARVEDFLIRDGLSGKEYKELEELIPFPTVAYTFDPDGTTLHATLTIDKFMGQEDYAVIKPHLRTERVYVWNGKKYEMQK